MDSDRFDAVSRRIGAQSTRRGVIGAAIAMLLGGVGTALVRNDAAALTCRADRQLCSRSNQCCSGFCEPPSADRLVRNRCACGEGTIACNGECVAPGTDAHCLGCDDRCQPGTICTSNGCVEACIDGQMRCSDGKPDRFETCDHGEWIARNCAPGTACRSVSGVIICDWPIG